MPGYVEGDPKMIGVKIINASLGNHARGLPRASGVTLLFDEETGQPRAIMDAAPVSAARTAAVSVAAIRELPSFPVRTAAVIGCGVQARAHLDLMMRHLHELRAIRLFDNRPEAAGSLKADVSETANRSGITVDAAGTPRDAIAGADAVVTATTVDAAGGYVSRQWLRDDAVVVHVSLDDLLPEVVEESRTIIVDDWDLVADDHRRLFGRMHREGRLLGPADPPQPGIAQVDGELGDFLQNGLRSLDGLTVVNPFGMAVQDVALASRVEAIAASRGVGRWLDE